MEDEADDLPWTRWRLRRAVEALGQTLTPQFSRAREPETEFAEFTRTTTQHRQWNAMERTSSRMCARSIMFGACLSSVPQSTTPVPYALRERIVIELNAMLRTGVIKPVDHFDWATPSVVVRKSDGGLRICDDHEFDMNQETVLTVDASARAQAQYWRSSPPGGVHERVVAYASRSLTAHEFKYNQIHKKALAIAYA
ncbi:hypothetical protein EVAR_56887_1 [Eumeta japonica]|uniref:Reverse transcriptase/retrotransposon-derived protein RNase H-like domain-containing protein n=1 Tax=Eumeta variegata TaxID=151549 RepID=A0A4C1ZKJ5_EUMVA|nr:hypothetical protein EVAR_56887_1 [Eumeta japonica]